MKNKSIILLVVIITLILYILLAFTPIVNNKSYAADLAPGSLSRDVDAIDDSIYPGYKSLIKDMQSKHSNYTFLLYYTGLSWDEVLVTEYKGHGRSPNNLVQVSNNYNGMWICPLCGSQKYDNGSWCCASLEALAYMMDPRNSINDSDIFQFKDLEGSDVTYDDIARAVSGYGTFINNPEAIQAIVDASNQYNVNGYFLVAKIINEHGKNGSTLSNGNGYNGNYVGCYNYFNIGSTGNGTANIINSGLSYAQNNGWTSIRNSIIGGTAIVKNSFITRYSQNTLYYQKFNVSGKSALGSHQYQQNIMAAQSQGSSLKSYYGSSSTPSTYTFIIPLYKNMPKSNSPRPNPAIANTISYEEGVVQNISTSLKVRASANGTAIGALNNNESIKIIKRATTQVGGYYWDLIVSNQDGTYGYAARNIDGKEVLVSTSGGNTSSSAPAGPNTGSTPSNPSSPVPTDNEMKISGNYVKMLPNMTVENVKAKFPDAVVKDASGVNVMNSGNIGTGSKIVTGGQTLIAVKKGDVDGDGLVTVVDAVIMLNAIRGERTLYSEVKEAACIKNDSEFYVTDVVTLLNYIKGETTLSL